LADKTVQRLLAGSELAARGLNGLTSTHVHMAIACFADQPFGNLLAAISISAAEPLQDGLRHYHPAIRFPFQEVPPAAAPGYRHQDEQT